MPPKPFKPIYVLHGDDGYIRDEHRRRITREVVGDADPQLAVCSHDGKRRGGPPSSEEEPQSPDGSPQSPQTSGLFAEVLADLTTPPLMAASRLVIVRDADAFVTANRDALERYLENPSPTAALLLLVQSWPSNTNLAKTTARIGQAVACVAPAGGGLERWVMEAASKRGNRIDSQTAGLLASVVGADLAALDNEVEKLSLYAGKGSAITPEHVHLLASSTAGAEDFGLVNAIAASDAKAALVVLDKELTRRGEEFRMLGQIGWYLRIVIHAQTLRQSGQDPAQALRVRYEARQTYLDLLKRRPLRKLQADCRQVLAADLAMKSGADAHATMQDLVLALCA
jgi:DNA polymerase-3 subunit delta